MIDLRSDTITKPTPQMREYMAIADVGDDVFGDDPTVIALEQKVAQLLGKQAAVFVPSGTMANQIAIRVHTRPGDEIIIDANAHVYYYEAGATAALSGVICNTIQGHRCVFSAGDVKAKLRPEDVHFARTRVICIENTTNRGGGKIWPIQEIEKISQLAKQEKLLMHMDGARLWNAAAATGIQESQWASHFDSLSVCFSKGLGAPMGSALVGTHQFIHEARRIRKQFGGGMRQAGIVAAGAIYALDHHVELLKDDHKNAKILAEELATIPNVQLNPDDVETNIIVFGVGTLNAPDIEKKLLNEGIASLAIGPNTMRFVTSLMVKHSDIPKVIQTCKRVLA